MKYFLVILFFVIATTGSYSQNRFVASIGAGISIPVSNDYFTNAYNMGFVIQGTGGYILSSNNVLVRGSLAYNNFPYDESNPNLSAAFKSISLKGEVGFGNFASSNTIQPYALAGLGIYFLSSSTTVNNVTTSASDTEAGISFGGGVNFRVGTTTSIFVESDYNLLFNDGSAKGYIPIKVGVFFTP